MTALIFGLACVVATVAFLVESHRRKQADRRADAAEAEAKSARLDLRVGLNRGARWQG